MSTGRCSKPQSCQIKKMVCQKLEKVWLVIRFFSQVHADIREDKICTFRVEIYTALNSQFTHDRPRLANIIPYTMTVLKVTHSLPSRPVPSLRRVWLVNALTSTAPIYWFSDNLRVSFSWTRGKDFLKPLFSVDVHGPGTRHEPLWESTWEASSLVQSLFTCCK